MDPQTAGRALKAEFGLGEQMRGSKRSAAVPAEEIDLATEGARQRESGGSSGAAGPDPTSCDGGFVASLE
eukprot:2250463-Heterocapsa_arctica.AAC.1